MAPDGLRPILHGTVRAMAPGGLTNEALVQLATPEELQALITGQAPLLATPAAGLLPSVNGTRCCITLPDGTYWNMEVVQLETKSRHHYPDGGMMRIGEVTLTLRGIHLL